MSKKPKAAAALPAEPSPALETIIARAQVLAWRRRHLQELVEALNTGIEALKADALPNICGAIDQAGVAWKELADLVQAHPDLFVRPRSIEAHGIKFGFQKGKGGLEIEDPEKTVSLIEKLMPDQVELLIAVKKSPVKDALVQLSAAELKKLGVEVKGTGDVVFIKPAEGAVDKLVKALVASATEEA